MPTSAARGGSNAAVLTNDDLAIEDWTVLNPEEFDLMMTMELSKEARADAIASIQRYFQENMTEPIGELAAGLLLNYFIEEIGPAIYNRAIADAQRRMELHVSDLNGELYADEFQYWRKIDRKRKNR